MRVRWTTDAADDLERICDYIAESRPESARRVAQATSKASRVSTRFQIVDGQAVSKGPASLNG
jgi:plasmid stabilization system protein ParE